MRVDFDMATKYVYKSFPFQFFWEFTEIGPFVGEGLVTICVLLFLDLRGLGITKRTVKICALGNGIDRRFSESPSGIHPGSRIDSGRIFTYV
jgi:hypothetical protein